MILMNIDQEPIMHLMSSWQLCGEKLSHPTPTVYWIKSDFLDAGRF